MSNQETCVCEKCSAEIPIRLKFCIECGTLRIKKKSVEPKGKRRHSRCVTTKPNGVASLQSYRSVLKVAVMAKSRWNPVEVERRPVLRLSRQVTKTQMEALTCGSVHPQRKVAEQSQL